MNHYKEILTGKKIIPKNEFQNKAFERQTSKYKIITDKEPIQADYEPEKSKRQKKDSYSIE